MDLNFRIFIYIFLFAHILLFNNLNAHKSKRMRETIEDLTRGLTNRELEEALGTLSLKDLQSLKSFMDSSFIVREDNYNLENSEDDSNQRNLQNNHFENTDIERNENAYYKIDENVIRYKRALLAAQLSWDKKRRARETILQSNAGKNIHFAPAALTKRDALRKYKRGSGVVKVKQKRLAEEHKRQNKQTRSVNSEVLRAKRENEPGQVINEDYMRQLEYSFPREQGQSSFDAVADVKEHVRIKRD